MSSSEEEMGSEESLKSLVFQHGDMLGMCTYLHQTFDRFRQAQLPPPHGSMPSRSSSPLLRHPSPPRQSMPFMQGQLSRRRNDSMHAYYPPRHQPNFPQPFGGHPKRQNNTFAR